MKRGKSPHKSGQQIEDLEARLWEAEETLRAIRSGEVDALVISGPDGEQIYTLKTAEHPYRVLVEAMSEGAVTLNNDDTILYCNQSFAALLKTPIEQVFGSTLSQFIAPGDRSRYEALLRQSQEESAKGQIMLIAGNRHEVPAHFSLNPLPLEGVQGVSIVVTDLTEQKRQQGLVASEKLLRSILDQAAEATVVCDERGQIIHASRRAHELCGRNPVLRHFDELLPLLKISPAAPPPGSSEEGDGAAQERLTFSAILESQELRSVEAAFYRADGQVLNLLLSAGLVLNLEGMMLGCVVTLIDITGQVAARKALEAANRLKDEFLATLSHELRNPLNSIIGYADVLLRSREAKQLPIIRKAAEIIHRNGEAQAQLINDLLDLSRLQTGKLAVDRQPMPLAPLLGDAVESVRGQAVAKELKLDVDFTAERLVVSADPVRVQQIVWNLVNNAVKFTPKGGRVSVSLNREGEEAEFAVADTGQGIDPGFLPHMFGMFRQSDAGTTRTHGGMGIGLALVKQLVELHGGRVEAHSEGKGRGARFAVRFPLHTTVYPNQSMPITARAEDELTGARILVVDDSQDSVELLRLLFTNEGATVTTASNGEEGLRLAKGAEFDLIISDISMPVMDGYDLLKNLRADQLRYATIPAIALTGFGRDEDVGRARQAGFTTHLTKPLDFDHLLRLAHVALRK